MCLRRQGPSAIHIANSIATGCEFATLKGITQIHTI